MKFTLFLAAASLALAAPGTKLTPPTMAHEAPAAEHNAASQPAEPHEGAGEMPIAEAEALQHPDIPVLLPSGGVSGKNATVAPTYPGRRAIVRRW
ncbi:Uncharacterized protein Y057_12108 [Fusarium fujikuroi]|nr:Uncharacterized protein Y057_12108 [Fusarium fujikuroi]